MAKSNEGVKKQNANKDAAAKGKIKKAQEGKSIVKRAKPIKSTITQLVGEIDQAAYDREGDCLVIRFVGGEKGKPKQEYQIVAKLKPSVARNLAE